MSTLIVHELETVVCQEILVGSQNLNVAEVCPYLLKFQTAAGSVLMQVQDVNGQVMKSSNVIPIVDLHEDAFFHGYISFDLNIDLMKNTRYRIALLGAGYTFSEAAYIGWCKQWDSPLVGYSYFPNEDFNAGLGLGLWPKETRKRNRP